MYFVSCCCNFFRPSWRESFSMWRFYSIALQRPLADGIRTQDRGVSLYMFTFNLCLAGDNLGDGALGLRIHAGQGPIDLHIVNINPISHWRGPKMVHKTLEG